MEDLILVTVNTSDTTERPCERKEPRSEKGWELDTQRHSTTRNADKRKDRSKASGGVKPKDTIKSKPSCRQIQLNDKEGSQELIQCTTSEESKVQESIQMNGNTPVAF